MSIWAGELGDCGLRGLDWIGLDVDATVASTWFGWLMRICSPLTLARRAWVRRLIVLPPDGILGRLKDWTGFLVGT